MGAKDADLNARARVLAEDRVAFADLEKRSRKALKMLYERGMEKPLDTAEDGPAQLLPLVVKALEEVIERSVPWRRRKLAFCLQPLLPASSAICTSATPMSSLTSCWSLWLKTSTRPPPQPFKVKWRLCWGSFAALSLILCLVIPRILRLVAKVKTSSPIGELLPWVTVTSRGDPRLFSLFYSWDIH